ncbi:MAG TPA: nucleotide pyrophosphatase, partial [Stellaceae bacterium]|nr:nucleotide pyrophosphatase [Stellaceae bacterium]
AAFFRRENWAGQVVAGAELAQVGLPVDGALQVAVAMATDDRVNPHGIGGYGAIVANPEDPEGKIGFGQHGGLGVNEQNPFLIVEGGGFAPRVETRPTSLIDIAPTVLRHLRMDHDDMDGQALPQGE